MSALYVNRYSFGHVLLELDEADVVVKNFARAYSFARSSGSVASLCYSIKRTVSGVVVSISDAGEALLPDYAAAFGYVDADLDRRMRAVASDSLLSVHASSAAIAGKAVLFLGLSGCGKTTLGIEVARWSEGVLGDEYALVDPVLGTVCFEPYPLQVKQAGAPGVHITCPNGAEPRACRAEDLGLRLLNGSYELGVIVLPNRMLGLTSAALVPVPVSELHKRLMPSVLGGPDRKATYRTLTRMLSTFGIRVLELRYGEAPEASDCLLEAFG